MVAPILNYLNKNDFPHIVFINKMDVSLGSIRDTFKALQSISPRALVLREIPIREDGNITGHVELISERALKWPPGEKSKLIEHQMG